MKSLIRKPDYKCCILVVWAFTFNMLIYESARFITRGMHHISLETQFDLSIPFLPWTVCIYWGCCIIWSISYYLSIKYERGLSYQFLTSHTVGEIVCFVIFLLLPTSMTRVDVTGNTIFDNVLRLTFAADDPTTLLPSMHCFLAWMSWIGVRRNRYVPKWYQAVAFIWAIAVCMSTLTVKQHVVADIPVSIIVAETSYLAVSVTKKYKANKKSNSL